MLIYGCDEPRRRASATMSSRAVRVARLGRWYGVGGTDAKGGKKRRQGATRVHRVRHRRNALNSKISAHLPAAGENAPTTRHSASSAHPSPTQPRVGIPDMPRSCTPTSVRTQHASQSSAASFGEECRRYRVRQAQPINSFMYIRDPADRMP
jgi:hypothetical protein